MAQEGGGATEWQGEWYGVEWRCFHCDEVFVTREAAAEHFGPTEECVPLCQVTAERYREVERQLELYRNETDLSSRTFYELGARHVHEVQRSEERGYERGLRDGTDRAVRIVRTLAAHKKDASVVDPEHVVVHLKNPDVD